MSWLDGTHKLVGERSVGLFLGTTDRANKVHPITFSLSNGEDEVAFSRALQTVQSFHPSYRPRVVVADAAEAYFLMHVDLSGKIRISCALHAIVTWIEM